jgi:hypothetical protein
MDGAATEEGGTDDEGTDAAGCIGAAGGFVIIFCSG